MAVASYSGVSWADDEPIFTDKLNQMAQNDQWFFENMPTVLYTNGSLTPSIKRQKAIKVLSGILLCQPSATGIQNHVQYFGSYFTAGCNPVIVTSLLHNGDVRLHLGHKGIGQPIPDHRGFEVLGAADQLNLKANRMTKPFYITWLAVGY